MIDRIFLLIILLLCLVGTLMAALMASPSASAGPSQQESTPTPYPTYPTDYPPGKQTLEVEEWQTQAAAALTPYPTGTVWILPRITSTPGPTLIPPPATPAGDGEIIDINRPSLSKLLGINIINRWSVEIGDLRTYVLAGSDWYDDAQGMFYIYVDTVDGHYVSEDYYLTPTQSGPVRIVGAVGSRLILVSEGGETYYFDVPGRRFTDSLSESVPSLAPLPTFTPSPTRTPAYTDDAPNRPNDLHGLSPVNTTLSYTISFSGDEDWFRFYMPAPGTLRVALTNLPADYDLYVWGVTFGEYGDSTQSGTADEIVTIADAPDDDYVVRVVGVDGAFDAAHPYQIRFEVPASTAP